MWTRLLPSLLSLWTLIHCPSYGRPGSPSDEKEIRLSGSNCRCVGRPELYLNGTWMMVCKDSWNMMENLAVLCRQLSCGQPIGILSQMNFMTEKESKLSFINKSLQCQGNETNLLSCSRHTVNCSDEQDAIVVCEEPQSPPTTTPVPTTLPPKGPLKFRLIESTFNCSGTVEVHMRGSWRPVCNNHSQQMSDMICKQLGCGAVLSDSQAGTILSHSPVLRHEQGCTNMNLTEECFQEATSCKSLKVTCSNFEPKVATRLVNGTSRCEGNVQVYYQGHWMTLCAHKNDKHSRGQKVCEEQRCGKPTTPAPETRSGKSTRKQDGVSCTAEKLEECHTFSNNFCVPATVTCEDPELKNSKGLRAGDVLSIIFALLLFGIFVVICGPPIYKKVVKKYNQKKERQWIGPTGASQSISFHRNNTINLHSQPQDQNENEYSMAPKKKSNLSAYPALEAALNRTSFPVENSSDSEYDLQTTHRL
ncbi:T-cell surface glycoprotein CD5 isoform X2 [Microcaecilia unicolor]|uniref:T-cell surface glycoprotein CD5 isoform X2 n=1 Tax=Microcaecilia unicolor TaxID=1415580 RepID=A0A6P7ZYG5_9AMPH|nr:T-cell surface glycoprotein CD5 isoform X2 [Microcaecilia unicolor]